MSNIFRNKSNKNNSLYGYVKNNVGYRHIWLYVINSKKCIIRHSVPAGLPVVGSKIHHLTWTYSCHQRNCWNHPYQTEAHLRITLANLLTEQPTSRNAPSKATPKILSSWDTCRAISPKIYGMLPISKNSDRF